MPPAQTGVGTTLRRPIYFYALWIGLAMLAGARAALAGMHGMWFWGLDAMRFVTPLAAWLPWAAATLLLVPPLARRCLPPLHRVGETYAGRAVRPMLIAALLTAALVLAFPDRAYFKGDSVERNEAIAGPTSFLEDYPETLPLDLALHVELPRALARHAHVKPRLTLRLLGALEAALLGVLGVAYARALALGGSQAAFASIAVIASGALTMFTGFGKSAGELCLLTLATGVAAARVLVRREPAFALALALGAGLLLHRLTVLLLPAGLVILLLSARRLAPGAARRPRVWGPLVAGALLAVWALPAVVRVIRDYDLEHHLDPAALRLHGGLIGASFAGLRGLDIANLLVFFAPLAPLAAVIALAGPREAARGQAVRAAALVALPLLAVLPLLHPQQGLARDLDVTAPIGMAAALLVATLVLQALKTRPSAAWLALPAALACVAPSVQSLALDASVASGLTRAVRFLEGPPRRDDAERARLLAYLGDRYALLHDWRQCTAAYALAAHEGPSRMALLKWGLAARLAGDLASSERAYREMLARHPGDSEGWYRLAVVAIDRGEIALAREAESHARALAGADSTGREWLAALEHEMAGAATPAPALVPRPRIRGDAAESSTR